MRLDQRIRASSSLTQVSAAGQLLAPHRSALLAGRPGGAPENGVREQDVHLIVRDAGGVGVVFTVERDDVDHAVMDAGHRSGRDDYASGVAVRRDADVQGQQGLEPWGDIRLVPAHVQTPANGSFIGRRRGLGLPDTVEINLAAAHGWAVNQQHQ
jgi:hypothetical protein